MWTCTFIIITLMICVYDITTLHEPLTTEKKKQHRHTLIHKQLT